MRQRLDLGPVRVVYEGRASTRVYLLFGRPVAHSRSPAMQTAAMREAGIDAVYVPCDVTALDLPEVIGAFRRAAAAGRVGGANVTVPHKEAAAALVDALDTDARAAGAVNTLCVASESGGNRLVGCNTDVAGVVAALAAAGQHLDGACVSVLGAGGMARAAVAAALRAGACEVRVAGRSLERAHAMLDEIAGSRSVRLRCMSLDAPSESLLEGVDILVQATTLGMQEGDASPIRLGSMRPRVLLEAVYAGPTALEREARALGVPVVCGLELLAHQGAAAFALWTGRGGVLGVMRRSLGLP